jgi:phage tail-like protein
MASGEILACSKFYFQLDGLEDLIVKKVSGISIDMETAGDKKPFGVSKGGRTQMQATVTGVKNGKVTVEFVSTVEDNRLNLWYEECHSEPIKGGGTTGKGKLKDASIILYNQGGDEAARWNLRGVMAATYKSSKLEAGSTNLATETVEFVFHNLHRVK